MANDEQPVIEDVSRIEGSRIIAIPVNMTEAVLQFLASLQDADSDVSGYMLSSGLFGGISVGRLSAVTESGCVKTNRGKDWNCADTDSD
ncbi:MAG: hypothetical protein WBW04_21155 [Nitrolancea sp.]